ncbi:MAG: U32 family peptidase, partial [Gemmataceae bacterium]|nr:U32 family peptidase [Gemmataceae bacterium]
MGGRSANRGQCAQACRMPYDLVVDGEPRDMGDVKYLLSPLDLAGYDQVRRLAELGVASLKIEGRLKGPAYVAQTVQTYRKAVDAAVAGRQFHLCEQELQDLTQVYSRGFAPGFLEGVNHQQLVVGRFPKSRGVRIGVVIGVHRRGVLVQVEGNLSIQSGDGVVFDHGRPEEDEPGGRVVAVHPMRDNQVELQFDRHTLDPRQVNLGAIAWRTDDPRLRRRLESSYAADRLVHPIPVHAKIRGQIGGELWLQFEAQGHAVDVSWPGPLEPARNRPTTREELNKHLNRLGGTPFRLVSLDTSEWSEAAVVPWSVLNDLRRQLCRQLLDVLYPRHPVGRVDALQVLRESAAKMGEKEPAATTPTRPALHVLVRDMDQLEAVLPLRPDSVICEFEDPRRYRGAVERARATGVPVGLAPLRIVKPGEEGFLHAVASSGPDFVLIRNLAALQLFREHYPDIRRVGDFSLNVANELTADWLLSQGLERVTASYDLNWEQFTALTRRMDPHRVEAVVHQRMPMFHNEHCVFAATLSEGKDHRDCGRPCDRHRLELRDIHGAKFPVRADAGCRNTVYNLSLIHI